ncbi:MAG: hypothetical protein ACK5GN_09155 [Pseudomonadota bacterium]|jgi:hypothetical protein
MKFRLALLIAFTTLICLPAAVLSVPVMASATPHCRACPYSCSDLGMGSKDCSFVSESRGVCCLDLTKKALEVAMAQEQVTGRPGSNHAHSVREECPAGFRPSEQKCSTEERRMGCKDMRLPGGLGCVRR